MNTVSINPLRVLFRERPNAFDNAFRDALDLEADIIWGLRGEHQTTFENLASPTPARWCVTLSESSDRQLHVVVQRERGYHDGLILDDPILVFDSPFEYGLGVVAEEIIEATNEALR